MGAEESWQERLPSRWQLLGHIQAWFKPDDRGGSQSQRSRRLLVAGSALALAAVFVARTLPPPRANTAALSTVAVVAAAAEIGFGEKLTIQKLKLVDVPANSLPKGHFARIERLTQPPGHTAMRPIAANELITAPALAAGATRLSTAPLLGPAMRALSVPVDEVSGVSGLITPGDRVDVLMTRQPDEAMAHAELIAQNVRVLAVGSDMNIAREQAGAVKTVTLELTPAQAQKLTLALATGTIGLALRHFDDNDRIRLQSLQVSDLNDGASTRLIRKPGASGPAAAPPAGPPTLRQAKTITVLRGGEATQVPVLP